MTTFLVVVREGQEGEILEQPAARGQGRRGLASEPGAMAPSTPYGLGLRAQTGGSGAATHPGSDGSNPAPQEGGPGGRWIVDAP
jgi:hypothetical protein